MPTPANSLDISSAGLVKFDGTATFSGVTVTQHDLLIGGSSNAITSVAPSATSGVPVISQGASADPTFGTAVVAGGGTGDTSFTAYSVICGGTTSTGALQNVSGVGSSGQVLTSNGAAALPTWQATASSFTPNSTVNISDDFFSISGITGGALFSQLPWYSSGIAGGDFLASIATSNAHPGIVQNALLVANSAFMYLGEATSGPTSEPTFILGGGAITINWVIQINTLSSAGARYVLRMGLGDTFNGDLTNGVYFEYSDNINSGNWNGKTAKASTRTTASSSTAADTNWHNFQITVNAAASSIGFFIDGSQIANSPLTTNIPTAAVTPFISMTFVAGTVAASSVTVDLFYMTQTLTSTR